jgi:hypothetical protein
VAHDALLHGKNITVLIEVHGQDNYRPVVELLSSYNFKMEFENVMNGEINM